MRFFQVWGEDSWSHEAVLLAEVAGPRQAALVAEKFRAPENGYTRVYVIVSDAPYGGENVQANR
jgi:hypothetical protein